MDKDELKREIKSWVLTMVVALGIVIFMRTQLFLFANVPTPSMENTLAIGDNIVGNRLTYKFSEPQRGDVIIFNSPVEEGQLYVKRLIGLPGETVEIEDSKIYINGSDIPLEEDYLKEEWTYETGHYKFVIPEDSYLFLGDNRNNSCDAREWEYPYIKKDDLVAKAVCVYFPITDIKKL